MKTMHFTIKRPKPRNAVAVAARSRKAGVHKDRRERKSACRLREAVLADIEVKLDGVKE